MLEFKIVKTIPKLNPKAIERAVEAFVKECGYTSHPTGMYNQTLETIANYTFGSKDNSHHFWLAHEDGEVMGYAIATVTKSADTQMAYDMIQAWVHPKYRGKPIVKQWYQQLREKAKESLCTYINVISSRNVKPYLRFLGKQWYVSCTVLQENITEG